MDPQFLTLLPTSWNFSWFCIHCEWGHCPGGPHCCCWDIDSLPLCCTPWSMTSIMRHCGLSESSCFGCIWKMLLGGWQRNWEAELHFCKFFLWNLIGLLQGRSGWPTLWNPLSGNNIEIGPRFFSPCWWLPLVRAPSYPLGPHTMWLPHMWACYIDGVRLVVSEGTGPGIFGGLLWHT